MAKKEEKAESKAPAFFSADLELTSINKDWLRYRVVNHEGADCAIDHLVFNRTAFPVDDEFSMDFMLKDLGKNVDKATVRKQAEFRDCLSFKLEIR